jgi:predicted RNase H-like HicB family nuclease
MRNPLKSPFTALFIPAAHGGYCGFVAEVPGAHAQGATLDETRENLREALALMFHFHYEDTRRFLSEDAPGAFLIEEPFVPNPAAVQAVAARASRLRKIQTLMAGDTEHCPECGSDFNPRDLGEVFFHAFGHREANRDRAQGFEFAGEADPDAWAYEEPEGET